MKTTPVLLLIAATLAAPLLATAAEEPATKVNGVAIPAARIDAFIHLVAPGQPVTPDLREKAKEHLITQEAIAQEAVRRGLDKNTEGSVALEIARQQALAQLFLQDYAKRNPITDDAMKKEYERAKADIGDKEYKPRHILVKTEDEAKAIIAQIRKGGNFEKIAAEKSLDSSKSAGGDLGWSGAERYVPPFAAALKKLKKGQLTDAPVQSQFGWHVIRLDDERARKFPSFEEVKPQIQNQLQQQQQQRIISELRGKAKIE